MYGVNVETMWYEHLSLLLRLCERYEVYVVVIHTAFVEAMK